MLIKGKRSNIHPDRFPLVQEDRCEQFAYLQNLAVYPNNSDMNQLYAIVTLKCDDIYKERGE